jgi:hypothetical protein
VSGQLIANVAPPARSLIGYSCAHFAYGERVKLRDLETAMIQDPNPNTYGHCFSVEEENDIDVALTAAIALYTARWRIKPTNVFVHPSLIPIPSNQVVIIPHPRIPAGLLWFEVPVDLVKGGNGR